MRHMIQRMFFKPVDASSLAVFRIVFGALLLFESVNYGIFLCLDCMYRDTSMLFKYQHFEWVTLPPGNGLEWIFAAMGISAFCVMVGLFYRVAMIVLSILFSWLFLLDQALYLNHFYLVLIYCVIMIFAPAHRHLSLDARRKPKWASAVIPNWSRLWLAAQTELVLIYAGLVKLNTDWLNLEPMSMWMTARSADAAPFFQLITQDWGIALASYGVIVLHLLGAPLLLWRRTRLPVFLLYSCFHLINALVFDIGIFPFLTIGATLMLFDADWPRQFVRFLINGNWASRSSGATCSWLPQWLLRMAEAQSTSAGKPTPGLSGVWRRLITVAICVCLVAQTLIPLRHLAAPGNVAWNEDGHRFSWRMKLRSKQGTAMFTVTRDDDNRWDVDPAQFLNAKQTRKMVCIPDLIWQFSQYLDDYYSENGRYEVAVHATAICSLNGRDPAPLTNQLVDLTTIKRSDPVTAWTYPLTKPLPDPFL